MSLPDGIDGSRLIFSCRDAGAFITGNSGSAAARDHAASAILTAHAGSAVVVARRASGRPRLMPPWPELGVSLSHRDDFLLIGFSQSQNVGVDIEIADATLDVLRLARDHFAAAEYASLEAQPEAMRHDLFYRLWCAKEAVLKSTGRGIADGMQVPDCTGVIEQLLQDGMTAPVNIGGQRRATVAVHPVVNAQGRRFMAALAVLD